MRMRPEREDGLIVLTREGRVAFANSAAETLIGCALASAAGQPLASALGAEHPLVAVLRPAAAGGPAPLHYVKASRPDGAPCELRVMAHALPRADGGVETAIVIQDVGRAPVTDRRPQSSAPPERGRLAHEVRGPLNAIAIHLELLRRQSSGASPAVARSLDAIERAVRHLEKLVQAEEARSPS
jgi:signal transduction histidine kinase